jgi:hypothetical protein
MRIQALRPPLLAWLVVVAAVATGAYAQSRSPAGIFLYTPRNWCEGNRTNAFVLGYLAVLLLATLVCSAALLARLVAPSKGEHSSPSVKVVAALVLFLLSGLLSPVLRLAFPLTPDSACVGQGAKAAR